MLKHIATEKLLPSSKNSINLTKPGATVEKLISQLEGSDSDETVTDVIIHTGSNNLPRDDLVTLSNKISKAIHLAQKTYKNAQVFYSPIIPKHNNYIRVCDDVNKAVSNYCLANGVTYINTRSIFINNRGLRFERLSVHDRLHFNRDGIIAIGKHLKFFYKYNFSQTNNASATSILSQSLSHL